VSHDPPRDLNYSMRFDVACRWLEEEKRFRWLGVG
jgi:hypothetical protein